MNQVTWDDYGLTREWGGQLTNGHALINQLLAMPDVVKALEATGTLPHAGPGVDALGVEDVSATMASAEYLEDELIMWQRMRKVPAKSLTVEFSRLDAYQQGYYTGFIGSGDAGYTQDPTFSRGTALVRYMADLYETDLPTQLIEAIGPDGRGQNVMATNRMAAMGRLLRNIERNLYWADARLDAYQWKGLIQWIDAAATAQNKVRVDLQGGYLNKSVLQRLSRIGADNHANLTDFQIPNQGYQDLQISLFPEARTGEGVVSGTLGADFDKFVTLLLGGRPGKLNIERVALLSFGISGGMPLLPPTQQSPNPPTAPSSVTGAGASLTASNGHPGLPAGTYKYEVVAIGKGGNSLGTVSANITATAGQKITLTITDADESVLHYFVFRSLAGQSTAVRYFLGRVNRPAGGVSITWDDDGFNVPNTYHALGLTINPQRLYLKQLMPVLERKLPIGTMTNKAALLYFATPVMEEPTRQIHVANIGSLPDSLVATTGDQVV